MTSNYWAINLLDEILINKMKKVLTLEPDQYIEMVQISQEQNKFGIRYCITTNSRTSNGIWLHSEWHFYDSKFTLMELIKFISEDQ
jgi:hypothetical protein